MSKNSDKPTGQSKKSVVAPEITILSLLSHSFVTFRGNFTQLFLIGLIASVIATVITFVSGDEYSFFAPIVDIEPLAWGFSFRGFWAGSLWAVLDTGVWALIIIAGIYGAMQHLRNKQVTLGECFSIVPIIFLPVLAVTLLTTLGILLGAVFLIVPGVILALMWSLALPVMVTERTGALSALKRSRELTKGFRWRLFCVFVIALIGFWVVYRVVGLSAYLFPELLPVVILLTLEQALISAFIYANVSVVYYDIRLAKEGSEWKIGRSYE